MANKQLDDLVARLENYMECWKHFSGYINLARFKKFTLDDENQFLEVKSIITQELELILAAIENGPVTREEVHAIVTGAPSIRYLSEANEGALKEMESRWHKLFINLQSILGQLKVRQKQEGHRGLWASLAGKS